MGAAPEGLERVTPAPRAAAARRLVRMAVGALVVALAAQVAVPVPFSPVPMTLQPLAVLAVGGLLGASEGLLALVTYLALGALGLPVFAGGSGGAIHLVGPTGGYLLAFPVAAALVVPRDAFSRAMRHGLSIEDRARKFRVQHSCIALREGEVDGRPVGVFFRPGRFIARGDWNAPADIVEKMVRVRHKALRYQPLRDRPGAIIVRVP